ncbi:MAG TPA: SCO2322 family protein [Actinomycetes bacterium]|nr:SCO2322 family protein [Actinomycetes bacterium]
MTTTRRQASALLTVVVATLVATFLGALVHVAPADATSYRYWVYWTGGTGDWTFSSRGADRVPADGTVDGWRFAISQEAGSSATPRPASSFDAICGSMAPVDGMKRVGLVVDFGVSGDAPPGETPPSGPVAQCVLAKPAANGYALLTKVTSLRVSAGMICGIAGYPASGCGEAVADPKPSSEPSTTDHEGAGEATPLQTGASGASPGPGAATDPTSDTQPATRTAPAKSGQRNAQEQPGLNTSMANAEPSAQSDAYSSTFETVPDPSKRGSPAGLLVGITVVVALGALAFAISKRRS